MYNHDDAFVAWGNETLKTELYIDHEEVARKKEAEKAESEEIEAEEAV